MESRNTPGCPVCGHPVTVAELGGELYVAYIQWDAEHQSPPIGPFSSYGELEKAKKALRKMLRDAGLPVQRRVHGSILKPLSSAVSWRS